MSPRSIGCSLPPGKWVQVAIGGTHVMLDNGCDPVGRAALHAADLVQLAPNWYRTKSIMPMSISVDTSAMRLLEASVGTTVIALWLGHTSRFKRRPGTSTPTSASNSGRSKSGPRTRNGRARSGAATTCTWTRSQAEVVEDSAHAGDPHSELWSGRIRERRNAQRRAGHLLRSAVTKTATVALKAAIRIDLTPARSW